MSRIELTVRTNPNTHSGKQTNEKFILPETMNTAYTYTAKSHANYIIKNTNGDLPPSKILATRAGNDLLMSLDGDQVIDLILVDYYAQENSNLAFVAETGNGRFYNYVITSSEIADVNELNQGVVKALVLDNSHAIDPWWTTATDEGFSGLSGTTLLGALGAAVAIPALAAGGGGDGGNSNSDSNGNKAPTNIVIVDSKNGTLSIDENASGIDISKLSTTDPNSSDTHTYSVNDNRFTITNNTLKLKDGVTLDYDKEPKIELVITTTDSKGATFNKNITINVVNTDEPSEISGKTTADISEDSATISGIVKVTDEDASDNPINFQDSTQSGEYGDFKIVSDSAGNATWTYTLNNDKAQPLDEGETVTENFTVMTKDKSGDTKEQVITVTVVGKEDGPELSGKTTGEVAEDNANLTTASGQITVSDIDTSDNPVEFKTTSQNGRYGTFEMTLGDNGVANWIYTLDNEKAQALDADQVYTEKFIAEVKDSSGQTVESITQTISVNVSGSEDPYEVTGVYEGAVEEDNSEMSEATGEVRITDVDILDNPSFKETTIEGTYGTLKLQNSYSGKSKWTYTLDNEKAQVLDEGEVTEEKFTVVATDENGLNLEKEIIVKVTGKEDVPSFTESEKGYAEEDNPDMLVATGKIQVTDVDIKDNPISFDNSSQEGTYGNFELVSAEDGSASWTYTLDNNKAQELDEAQGYTEEFTVTTKDGDGKITEKVIQVELKGKNDAPVAVDEETSAKVEFLWGDNNVSNQLINNLGGEKGYGENEVDRLADDASSTAIDITSVFGETGLSFYGSNYTKMFINANGNITFKRGEEQYTPESMKTYASPMIAPFWADVDLSGEITNTEINRLWYDLDQDSKTLTVTWDQVGYFSAMTDKTNTFQLQITDIGNGDFDVFFRYQDIQWTVGGASGDTHAYAGWTAGDGKQFFEVPSSGDKEYMENLELFSNSGNPGVFEFNVRNGEVFEGAGSYGAIIDVLANDTDVDNNAELSLVSAEIIEGTGYVSITTENTLKYSATEDGLTMGNSEVIIKYTVEDQYGNTSSATAKVDITSNFVNTAPLSKDFSVESSGTYSFDQEDFPFIDPDLFNDLESVLIKTLPSSGNLMLNGQNVTLNQEVSTDDLNKLTYQFANGQTSPVTFEFAVKDNGGTINNGQDTSGNYTATISYSNTAHAPNAVNSSVETLEDTVYTFQQSDFKFTDKQDGNELDSIIIDSFSDTNKGVFKLGGETIEIGNNNTISMADIGNLTYEPSNNDFGDSSALFTYKVVDDGEGSTTSSNSATMSINVTSVNDGAPSLLNIENVSYDPSSSTQLLFKDFEATDPDVGISDILNTNVTIEAVRADGANVNDVFSFDSQTGASTRITLVGVDIKSAGINIGQFNNDNGKLSLEFKEGVSLSTINRTLDTLSYKNDNVESGDSITLAWTINDNDPGGALSTSYDQTIQII